MHTSCYTKGKMTQALNAELQPDCTSQYHAQLYNSCTNYFVQTMYKIQIPQIKICRGPRGPAKPPPSLPSFQPFWRGTTPPPSQMTPKPSPCCRGRLPPALPLTQLTKLPTLPLLLHCLAELKGRPLPGTGQGLTGCRPQHRSLGSWFARSPTQPLMRSSPGWQALAYSWVSHTAIPCAYGLLSKGLLPAAFAPTVTYVLPHLDAWLDCWTMMSILIQGRSGFACANITFAHEDFGYVSRPQACYAI